MDVKDWILLALSFVITLIGSEIVAWAPSISKKVTVAAVSMLPHYHRARAMEEWQREIEDIPGPIAKILAASTWMFKAGVYPASSAQDVAIRLADVTISAILLLGAVPLILLVSIAVVVDSRGSPLFKQKRIGRDGRVFLIYRIRSITLNEDAAGPPLQPMYRTRLGRFLRRNRIDKLPELLLVLLGEMSLVGPCPIRLNQTEIFGDAFADYQLVRPGFFYVSQASNPFRDNFQRGPDLQYIRSRSLGRYFSVLVKGVFRPPS